MIKRSWYYLLGLVCALAIGAAGLNIASLEAVSSEVAVANLPSELRMALDLGIIDRSDLRSGNLNAPIRRLELAILLKNTLMLLGDSAASTMADLRESGILDWRGKNQNLSRKEGLEMLCRTVIHLSENGFLSLGNAPDGNFADYQAPPKYAASLAYLKASKVVRGYGNGVFGVRRALSKGDAAFLIYRMYEQVSSHLIQRSPDKGISFVDLPFDHVVMDSLRRMEKAGGFATVPLRASFDGNKGILAADAAGMIEGILAKAGNQVVGERVEGYLNALPKRTLLSRKDFACMLEILIQAGIIRNPERKVDVAYSDVAATLPEASALESLAKCGVKMGYGNGFFRGGENITWFEAVGVIDAVLKAVKIGEGTAEDQEKKDPLLKQDEFQEFVNIVKAKKARIRSILRKNPVKPRT